MWGPQLIYDGCKSRDIWLCRSRVGMIFVLRNGNLCTLLTGYIHVTIKQEGGRE